MKKLGKLQINPEKVMKNEKLIALRGGYGECWYCYIFDGWNYYPLGCTEGPSCDEVAQALYNLYHPGGYEVGCTGDGCSTWT